MTENIVLIRALQSIILAYDSNSFVALDAAIEAARKVTPTIISQQTAFHPRVQKGDEVA